MNCIQNILSKGSEGLPFAFENFNGWNSLTASNLTIDSGASSELTARDEIHINSEFEAHAGSEVHIYSANTFPDCNDYTTSSTFQMQNRVANGSNGKREIDLTFLKPGIENTISVIPVTARLFNVEPHPYPEKKFREGDPFIEQVKHTGIEIRVS